MAHSSGPSTHYWKASIPLDAVQVNTSQPSTRWAGAPGAAGWYSQYRSQSTSVCAR